MKGLQKWFLVAGLVLSLGLLAGCGGDKKADSGEIVIGNLQDLSGPTSVNGNMVARGAELAVERINAAGGVNGKKIRLVTLDTKGDVQEAIKAYNRLVDQEKAVAVVGPPVSNIGLALAPIANQKKVPILGSFIDPRVTVDEKTGKAQPAMFLMQPSSIQYGEILAGYSLEKMNVKKFGILYDQSNAFAVSMIAPFKKYVEAHGGEVVIELVYAKGDKDFKTQLAKIKEAGVDALYAPNYTQDMVIIAKQKNQVGLQVPMISGIDAAPPLASLINDPEAANNIYFANNISEKEPQLQEVSKAYKEKYKEDAINKSFLGYDAVYMLADSVKREGATGPGIIKGLETLKDLPGTTGVLTMSNATHQLVVLSMVMYEIKDGKYVELERYALKK